MVPVQPPTHASGMFCTADASLEVREKRVAFLHYVTVLIMTCMFTWSLIHIPDVVELCLDSSISRRGVWVSTLQGWSVVGFSLCYFFK